MTDSIFGLKVLIAVLSLVLLIFACYLWFSTPELFEYFNQAFCAH